MRRYLDELGEPDIDIQFIGAVWMESRRNNSCVVLMYLDWPRPTWPTSSIHLARRESPKE